MDEWRVLRRHRDQRRRGALYCGLAAVIGLPVAWFYLSRFGLAWMIVAMLFAARWRQLNIRTGPEFYALRFGGPRRRDLCRVYTALFAVAVSMVPWIGAELLGTHKIMQPVLGCGKQVGDARLRRAAGGRIRVGFWIRRAC